MMIIFLIMTPIITILPFVKHPLSIGFIILLQTLLVSVSCGMFIYSYWYSFILFITFVGGMMVLFIYMASVASNEKFKFSFLIFILFIFMFLFMFFLFFIDLNFIKMNFSLNELYNYGDFNVINNDIVSLMYMYNYPTMFITILMIINLLITMISVVKITNIDEGPLRIKN